MKKKLLPCAALMAACLAVSMPIGAKENPEPWSNTLSQSEEHVIKETGIDKRFDIGKHSCPVRSSRGSRSVPLMRLHNGRCIFSAMASEKTPRMWMPCVKRLCVREERFPYGRCSS